MLAIRLQRIGKKHQPSYRIVVAEKRSKLGGPPVENIGSYNPFSKSLTIKKERVMRWLQVGAKPTVTVYNLLVKAGIIPGPKIKIAMRSGKKGEELARAEETGSANAGAVESVKNQAIDIAASKEEESKQPREEASLQ